MSDDTAQFEAIAPTLRWMPKVIRENLSPKAAWTVIVVVFLAGAWFTREVTQRESLQRANTAMQLQQSAQLKVSQDQNDHLAQLDTKLAVLLEKIDNIGHRVDEQQSRWDRVEEGADIPIPKVNKKHK